MAYSSQLWLKARGYYEAGLSLSEVSKKTSISKTQLSDMKKTEQWVKGAQGAIVDLKVEIAEKTEQLALKTEHLTKTEQACVIEVANDNIRRKNLVFGLTEKILKKSGEMVDTDKIFLNAQDLKALQETADRASITLGINERHAKTQIGIQNNQMQNANIIMPSQKEIRNLSDELDDL